MIFHRLVIWLWATELTVFPVLALLDLGFAYEFKSNYYARFFYMGLVALAVLYHAVVRRRVVLPLLSVLFLLVLVVGSLKGLWERHYNTAYLSHLFYVLMPGVMISYGWHFFSALRHSLELRRLLKRLMVLSLVVGVVVVAIFVGTKLVGLAKYDAIGLWNFVFAGPFLLSGPNGLPVLCLSTLGALLAAKRGVLIVFVIYIGLLFLLLTLLRRLKIVMGCIVLLLGLVYFSSSLQINLTGRLAQSRDLLMKGEIDTASGARWSEAAAALEYLGARTDHLMLGAGFGAYFLPWPDREGYANYYSHYAHFGIVSYMWIGGVFFSAAVYGLLCFTAVRMMLKVKRGVIGREHMFLVFWLWGILGISLFGAVLMNNAWLWLIIGCCLHLDRATSPRRPALE